MTFREIRPRAETARRRRGAFSLVELLCVLAITSLLTALVLPAFNGMKDADSVTNATYTISGELQRARSYAMAHNTYVWVGFYEEAADAAQPTDVFPYTGMGRVILGMAASVDGTPIFANGATAASLPASDLVQIDKLIRVENVHLTDLGAPTGSSTLISNRPNGAYGTSSTELYGINSDNSTESTPYPFTLGAYTFYKTIRFSPSGEASIDGSTSLRRIGEIDLRPTHGDTLNQNTPNVAAIQFTGIGGGVQTYRN